MKIEILKAEDVLSAGLVPSNVFGTAEFIRLNAHKADELVAAVGDNRIGVVFGLKDDVLRLPWSAPYLSVLTDGKVGKDEVKDFGRELRTKLNANYSFKIVDTPLIYNGVENAFFEGFRRESDSIITDTSFHVHLLSADNQDGWNRNGKRNLRKAFEAGLTIEKDIDGELCYKLIAAHHEAHGYTMAMTKDDVLSTAKILPADFWIVRKGSCPVSAAYCFRVRDDVVQVINSGATPEGRDCGAMIFMAHSLITHYRDELVLKQGVREAILDYGPTSVDGVQNEGLAAFKSSFGATVTAKSRLIILG